MIRRFAKSLLLFVASAACADSNPPSILNYTDHITSSVQSGLTALGVAYTNTRGATASTPLALNITCPDAAGLATSVGITFTAIPSGTSGTLQNVSPTAGGWPFRSGIYQVQYTTSSGSVTLSTTFTNGSYAVSFSGGTSGITSASASVTNLICTTGAPTMTDGGLAQFNSINFSVPPIIANALSTATPEYAAYTGNNTPAVFPTIHYKLVNESATGYSLAFDQTYYSQTVPNDLEYVWAYCGTPQSTDYPPIGFSTVLPVGNSNNCEAASFGIEFSISSGYVPTCTGCTGSSLDTSSPSATTESLTAVLAGCRTAHPSWTWSDCKGALRQNAGNWATGYALSASGGYGYGNINYGAALAVASNSGDCGTTLTGAGSGVCLQPPGFAVANHSSYATLTIYPFVTTRRANEVIYAFSTAPSFPNDVSGCSSGPCNEYTYAQVTALGGVLLAGCTTNGAAGPISCIYTPSVNNITVYFVAFTVDSLTLGGSEHYSRGEIYSAQSSGVLNLSYSCLR